MIKFFFAILLSGTLISCHLEKFTQGKRLYEAHCSSCHMAGGTGLGELYPAIDKTAYLTEEKIAELPCLIMTGRRSTTLSTIAMPPNNSLSEAEMINLINYMYDQWGDPPAPTLKRLQSIIKSCKEL